jgi:hypothetical protein
MRNFAHILLPGIVLLLGGCVIVPYQPPAETKLEVTEVPNPERVRLTIGPGNFLKKLAKETLKLDHRLTQVDTRSFIDTAAPGGELTLAGLLDPAMRARVAPLQVDYLVVLGQPKDETLSKKGEMVFYGGFYGLRKSKDSTTNWAAVIDLRELRLVEQLTSNSTGTGVTAKPSRYSTCCSCGPSARALTRPSSPSRVVAICGSS